MFVVSDILRSKRDDCKNIYSCHKYADKFLQQMWEASLKAFRSGS